MKIRDGSQEMGYNAGAHFLTVEGQPFMKETSKELEARGLGAPDDDQTLVSEKESGLTLSPLWALTGGMVFLVKAGILSGEFYVQAAAQFLTGLIMALVPSMGMLILEIVSAICFFYPGYKYHRQFAGSA